MNFKELGLNAAIFKALEAQGYQTPTPIQEGAIPPALAGRDVLGIAQTGTGKTCAFATPILQRLAGEPAPKPKVIRALILTPTRELALQIQESFEAYGRNIPLKSAVIFGGVGQQPQVDKLKRGVDILVATPGRLLDLSGQGLLDLEHVSIFVLDEADRMLDMGFIHDVRRVLKLLPQKKQTLFFSATMPPEVQGLVNELLHDPAKVAVTPVSSPVEVIQQSLYFVDKGNKGKLLAHLVSQPGVKNALVFSRTKHGANKIAQELTKAGISAAAIHGNKSQTARQQALGDFKAGRVKVLAATDIAARGLDIEELSHVFNYNLPDVPETYVHRIGRTGRAGHGGVAVSFCDFGEKDELKAIEKLLGKPIPVVEDHPWPMTDFTPPQRDKHGKIVNAEDAEARQAARERKKLREEGKTQAVGKPAKTARTAQPAPEKETKSGGKSGRSAQPAPKAAKPAKTPGEKRQAAGYKASKTLDDALHAMSPKTSSAQTAPSTQDEAFRRWMEEERRIQAQKGYISDPLGGDEVMDATARLLAPKKPAGTGASHVQKSAPSTPERGRKGTSREQAQPNLHPRRKESASRKAAAKLERPAPAQKTSPQPKKAEKQSALEAKKAEIRAKAKSRRNARPERPRATGQMDSTEHHSLMKPYYLNDD